MSMALLCLCLALLTGCTAWSADVNSDVVPERIIGKRPVYFPPDAANVIEAQDPREIISSAGLAIQGDFIYIVDAGIGLHIIDNTDPTAPIALKFISIPGIETVTLSGSLLYVNNFGDLVTIDISDLDNISVVDREVGLFRQNEEFPSNYFGYFECYDENRGPLVRWEDAEIMDPQCQTP